MMLTLVRFLLRVFYRRIRYVGAERVASPRPVIFVLNHPNALVDPLFVLDAVRRPVHFLAKAPLMTMPVLGYILRHIGSLPVYRAMDGADTRRNEETFKRCHEVLARAECIAIFPEGTTHSEARLKPMKTGAARIALGAESVANFTLGVEVVPVGLHYEAKQAFRSDVTVWFGEGHTVTDLADRYSANPHEAVHFETRRLAAALADVTLNVDRQETIDLIAQATEIFSPSEESVLLRRQFSEAYAALSEQVPDRISRLRRSVARHLFLLRSLGVTTRDLIKLRAASRNQTDVAQDFSPALHLAVRALAALPMLLLAAIGAIFEWIPYRLTGVIATRLNKGEEEMTATLKVIAGAVLYPVWWMATSFVVGWLAGWVVGVALLVLHPVVAYLALTAIERLEAFARTVRLFRLSGNRRRIERLQRHEEAIRQDLQDLAQMYAGGQ